jgi:putative DNA primase/helicase
MAKKIEIMLERYQENVYPAMLEDLATHLGVSYESLAQLQLGWAPIVHFKKGDNHQGWWTVPERDEKGDVVGIGLRSQHDMKCMAPLGCSRGMIYAVNPEHQKGSGHEAYKAGPQNWMRTMDAGVDCPVCGKPDGCLISAEDTTDPQAAICIRESKGAKKEVRGGGSWLHQLKAAGQLNKHASILADSPYPILIVEGMTDTAAAMDLGFVAVGRANDRVGLLELSELVRGRNVVIIGENDLKPDGKHPGHEGMLAAAQVLRRTCNDVVKLMPPTDSKDLRAWVTKHGLTRDDLLQYVTDRGDRSVNIVVLNDDQPRTAGLAFLDEAHKIGDTYTLRKWKGNTFYRYRNGHYKEAESVDVSSPLYDWAVGKSHMVPDKNGQQQIKPIRADQRWVSNVMAAIHNTIMLDPDAVTPPGWINGVVGPEPHTLIPFTNGILDVRRYLAHDAGLMESTPDYFNLIQLPYAFDEMAKCDAWIKFINEALGDDPVKIKLLQQWMGYCLTFDNQFQKFMIMRGVKSSGKSTILNVIRSLVGEGQYLGTKFDELQGNFGLEDAIGKLVCGVDEAQITRKTDIQAVMDVIRTVSGNAPIGVKRKFKTGVTLPLRARITMTCNETPYLPDNADAMARRMLLLEFDREAKVANPNLLSTLEAELPGIAVWALQGLKSLHQVKLDGTPAGFVTPRSMKQGLENWTEFTNPVGTFYKDCCEHVPGKKTNAKEVYDALEAWCLGQNIKAPSMSRFYERLRFTAPSDVARSKETCVNTQRPTDYITNLILMPWARKAYLEGER